MTYERLTSGHVLGLYDLTQANAADITPALAAELVRCGGWAAVEGERPLAIGGIFDMGRGRGLAWAWMTRAWRKHAREITARVAEEFACSDFVRIEAAVKCGFAGGENWLKRLGFTMEAERMAKWDGADDFSLWARVK